MGFRENLAYVLDTSPDKIRRQSRVPEWSLQCIAPMEDGWLVRATNNGEFGAQLNIQELEYEASDGAAARLAYLTDPFANPGESVDLKFSIKNKDKRQVAVGILKVGLLYFTSGADARVYYLKVNLSDTSA